MKKKKKRRKREEEEAKKNRNDKGRKVLTKRLELLMIYMRKKDPYRKEHIQT